MEAPFFVNEMAWDRNPPITTWLEKINLFIKFVKFAVIYLEDLKVVRLNTVKTAKCLRLRLKPLRTQLYLKNS